MLPFYLKNSFTYRVSVVLASLQHWMVLMYLPFSFHIFKRLFFKVEHSWAFVASHFNGSFFWFCEKLKHRLPKQLRLESVSLTLKADKSRTYFRAGWDKGPRIVNFYYVFSTECFFLRLLCFFQLHLFFWWADNCLHFFRFLKFREKVIAKIFFFFLFAFILMA